MDRPDFGTDIQLSHRLTLGSALYLNKVGNDLGTVDDMDNFAQAIWLRLGVPRGDLTHLGHPDFGSRLHLLIGRLATPETLALARAYVREALRGDDRIADIGGLEVVPDPTLPGTLLISVGVLPSGRDKPVNLSMKLALEPGQTEGIPGAATRG